MIDSVDTLLALVLLSVLFSFGTSRLPALIKIIAFQGIAVSIVPLFIGHGLTTGGTVFTLVTLLIRGIVIPLCIYLAIKKVAIRREVEPIVGYHASLLVGLILIVAATFVIPASFAICSINSAFVICLSPSYSYCYFPKGCG